LRTDLERVASRSPSSARTSTAVRVASATCARAAAANLAACSAAPFMFCWTNAPVCAWPETYARTNGSHF
jgi:hypothetical protein